MNKKLLIVFTLVILAVAIAGRLVPHVPNFTPVGAVALFAGMYLAGKSKWALALPLGLMFLTDLAIGFYDTKLMVVVYGSFLLYAVFGMLVRNRTSIGSVTLATLSGSLSFYLITNFAVWAFSTVYPATLQGLLLSYTMALPFLKFTLLGDIFFISVFVGGYELARRTLESRVLEKAFLRISK